MEQPSQPASSHGPLLSAPGAVAALVCGILSIVVCWIPLVGLILGIVALVMASKAKAAAVREPDRFVPGGVRVGGFVCGIIGTVFSGFYLIWWIFIVLFVVSNKDALGDFEKGLQDGLRQQQQHIERQRDK